MEKIELTKDEMEELENYRQIKKSRTPINLPSLVPAMPKYVNFPEIFSKEEILKIFKTIETSKTLYEKSNLEDFMRQRDLTMIALNYFLALRPSEVVMLRYSDIQKQDDGSLSLMIRPDSNKIRTGRVIPIPEHIKPILQKWFMFRGSTNFMFPAITGGHISRDRYREIFAKIMKESGLGVKATRGKHGGRTLYSLRHSRATHLLDLGANIFDVQQILGHKSLEVTAVYLHRTQAFQGRLKNVLEKDIQVGRGNQ